METPTEQVEESKEALSTALVNLSRSHFERVMNRLEGHVFFPNERNSTVDVIQSLKLRVDAKDLVDQVDKIVGSGSDSNRWERWEQFSSVQKVSRWLTALIRKLKFADSEISPEGSEDATESTGSCTADVRLTNSKDPDTEHDDAGIFAAPIDAPDDTGTSEAIQTYEIGTSTSTETTENSTASLFLA
ncbi:hypothetical protein MPSEU_000915100 [Mayamaea pseudoterrestris]|nr:hypothetical protein MPSEU_000915100 [Mayamaea pseudoterrestris]